MRTMATTAIDKGMPIEQVQRLIVFLNFHRNDTDINKHPITMWIFFRFTCSQISDLILNILPICDK